MMLNKYETVYILKPNITDHVNLALINEYKNLIRKNGGRNVMIQHRGRRHLSYNIMHYYDGIYVQVNYEGNGDLVKIIERSMRFNDSVIRYLTVKQNSLVSV
uniref:30S ribosomal protein S6, chloroplastic n=1 Tax=Renouxia sp. TaxID=2485823 RepID=A0A3G3MHN6_9FLOR|nr:ribosomal protein S6 [Renouxia sp.]